MHVPTHLALSWLVGHRLREPRDRRLVAWAGTLPDLDGLTILGGAALYTRYHHMLTHGLAFGLIVTVVFTAVARDRVKVALLSSVSFHLHLLCDLVGAGRKGPDWPIVYLFPFSSHEYFSPYGWPLASWQNAVITVGALIAIAWIGMVRGATFAETFLPAKGDAAIVEVLRRRFGHGRGRAHPQ